MMDGICEKLDKKNSAHCKHIVDDYYIPAFEVIYFFIFISLCIKIYIPRVENLGTNAMIEKNVKD